MARPPEQANQNTQSESAGSDLPHNVPTASLVRNSKPRVTMPTKKAKTAAAATRNPPAPATVPLWMSKIQRAQYEAQKAAPTTSAADETNMEDRETCRICNQEIVEATANSEGQEALLCEGVCKAWFHRRCLAVPTYHFELSNSTDPYVCLLCTTEKQAETIAALQQSVCALTKEVCDLKAAMANTQQRSGTASTTWSTVVSRSKRPPRNPQQELPRELTGARPTQSTRRNRNTQPESPIALPTRPTQPGRESGSHTHTSAKGLHPGQRSMEDLGDPKKYNPTAIANTIKTITGLSDLRKKNLVIKRKYKTSHSNSKKVTKWWFVVRGDESMLEQLTTKWNSIEVQTAWKLEPVLCYKKNDIPASDDQSTAVTTPLTIPTCR